MSDDSRRRSTRTHAESTGGSSHGQRRRRRQNRTASRGYPHGYVDAYPNSQNEGGRSTIQEGLADNPHPSPDTSNAGAANAQGSSGTTASSVSTADYRISRMGHNDVTFGSYANNHPVHSAVPPEGDDDLDAGTYPSYPWRPETYPYPQRNSIDPYANFGQPLLYPTALTSASPAQYYASSGYPAFDPDGTVSHAAAEAGYTSSGAAGAAPTTFQPPDSDPWDNSDGIEERAPFGEELAPDAHYSRGRTGSGDSGTSIEVAQGSVGDLAEQSNQEDARDRSWRDPSNHDEYIAKQFVNNDETSWNVWNVRGTWDARGTCEHGASPEDDDLNQDA
ncbi:hypothetical protein Hte_008699 [Hypoxylon texense]